MRRSNRSAKRPSRRTQPDQSLVLLKQLVESSRQQQTSQQPKRPDRQTRTQPHRDRVYSFTQSYIGPTISVNLVETDGSMTFTLSALANAAAFATIFDRYRIREVNVGFFPFATESVVTSGTEAGPLYTVLDYDDATATTVANLVAYDNLKVAPVGAFFERTLTPRIALAAYSGVFTSFAQGSASQWLDVASPAILYYGIKYGTSASLAASPIFTTLITVEIEFSHPR